MASSPIDAQTAKQSEHLATAQMYFARLVTNHGKPAELVPKIRKNLEQAGLDASALSLDGSSTAEEIEQVLAERLKKASSKHFRGPSPGKQTR